MPKKGYKPTEEHKRKLRESNLNKQNGRHYSIDYEFKKGHKAWNKGKEYIQIMNEKNGMWKGDKVGIGSIHSWVKRRKPKSFFCEKCGKITDKLEASCINHMYKRDISCFRWLCHKCHAIEDTKLRNTKK